MIKPPTAPASVSCCLMPGSRGVQAGGQGGGAVTLGGKGATGWGLRCLLTLFPISPPLFSPCSLSSPSTFSSLSSSPLLGGGGSPRGDRPAWGGPLWVSLQVESPLARDPNPVAGLSHPHPSHGPVLAAGTTTSQASLPPGPSAGEVPDVRGPGGDTAIPNLSPRGRPQPAQWELSRPMPPGRIGIVILSDPQRLVHVDSELGQARDPDPPALLC